jgi:hypothetical protein
VLCQIAPNRPAGPLPEAASDQPREQGVGLPPDAPGLEAQPESHANGGEQRSAYLKLDQKSSDITGSAGPDAGAQLPIARGKIATVNGVTTVTFEVAQPDGPPLKFELQVVIGRLKGKATAEANGGKREATVDVGRAANQVGSDGVERTIGIPPICERPSCPSRTNTPKL